MAAQSLGASAPVVFNFSPSFPLRITMRDGNPWFVAKDIAEALDYVWKGVATIGHVPEEWRGVCSVQTPSNHQEMLCLSEPGVNFFICRSDKPKALAFQKWLAGEVLPSIRKTGSYTAHGAVALNTQFTDNDQKNLQRLVWAICDRFHTASTWKMFVWQALRRAANHPAPLRFETRHLPALAEELRRILEIAEAVSEHNTAIEKEAVRRILRNREDAAPFVEEIQAEEAHWLNQAREWPRKVADYRLADLGALLMRSPGAKSDHGNYAEPAPCNTRFAFSA